MRKRGIPKEYIEWYLRRSCNRKTRLVFDGFQSELFPVGNGVDQGDAFSGISYLIYNSDLPETVNPKAGENALLFVDDTAIIATGKNFNETHAKLKDIMTRAGGVFEWAETHNCEFGIDKFQL